MSILNNYELLNLCHKLKINITDILSKDLLNKYDYNKNNIFIINLEDSKFNGSHWVAIFDNIYFDSFGIIAPYEIEKYFEKSNNKEYLYNNFDYQNINDSYCGWFVLYFLYYMSYNKVKSNKIKFKNFLKLFDKKNNKNNYNILFDKLKKIL